MPNPYLYSKPPFRPPNMTGQPGGSQNYADLMAAAAAKQQQAAAAEQAYGGAKQQPVGETPGMTSEQPYGGAPGLGVRTSLAPGSSGGYSMSGGGGVARALPIQAQTPYTGPPILGGVPGALSSDGPLGPSPGVGGRQPGVTMPPPAAPPPGFSNPGGGVSAPGPGMNPARRRFGYPRSPIGGYFG